MTRPRSLSSKVHRFQTEYGGLYLIVSVGDDGRPYEVFGHFGKAGSLQRGNGELACRLASMLLRNGADIGEIIKQCQGVYEMQQWPNVIDGQQCG